MHAQDENLLIKEGETNKHLDNEEWYGLLLVDTIEFLCVLPSWMMEGYLMKLYRL